MLHTPAVFAPGVVEVAQHAELELVEDPDDRARGVDGAQKAPVAKDFEAKVKELTENFDTALPGASSH